MNTNPIYDFLKDSKGVIHIGASYGQERDIYANMNLPVVWIEANPGAYQVLLKNIEYHGNQIGLNYLITDKNDPQLIPFHLTNNSWSSSIFELKRHKEVWPEVEHDETLYLHQYTLDHALTAEGIDVEKYDTLILDVQGAELKVLQGAEKILHNFKYIRCEATNAELYEGQCLDHNLDRYLIQRGFQRIKTWECADSKDDIGVYEILYQSHFTIKNTEIEDPLTNRTVKVKVGTIVSEPRLGFSVHKSVMYSAFGNRNYPQCKVTGAFWEQSIQNAMNIGIRLGCDYLITVDYDSIFSSKDVDELLLMAVRYPEADIVTSWQMKRWDGPPTTLIGFKGENGELDVKIPSRVVEEEISKVDHCVFGLTLIKVDKLLKIPKPWFQSFPNAEGEWEDGKIDADAYFFRKWTEYGNTIYCANLVKIGHLDEVILWIDDEMQPIRQSLSSYYKQGRPF